MSIPYLPCIISPVPQKTAQLPNRLEYKGVKIKKVPRFLWFAFNPRTRYALAYNSQIYVSPKVYDSLKNKNPDSYSIALLEHEIVHLKHKKQLGKGKHSLKYLLSPNFRLQEELAADTAMMKYLKGKGLSFSIEKRAKVLSSGLYLWMISCEEAKGKLSEIWK